MMPTNRNRPGWLVLLTLALVPVGCTGSVSDSAGGDGKAAADRFLEEIQAGRIEPAWQGTSTEFKSLMGLDSLRDLIKTRPALKGRPEHLESRRLDRDGLPLAEHVYRAQGKARGKAVSATIRVVVSQGGPGWTVEKISVD